MPGHLVFSSLLGATLCLANAAAPTYPQTYDVPFRASAWLKVEQYQAGSSAQGSYSQSTTGTYTVQFFVDTVSQAQRIDVIGQVNDTKLTQAHTPGSPPVITTQIVPVDSMTLIPANHDGNKNGHKWRAAISFNAPGSSATAPPLCKSTFVRWKSSFAGFDGESLGLDEFGLDQLGPPTNVSAFVSTQDCVQQVMPNTVQGTCDMYKESSRGAGSGSRVNQVRLGPHGLPASWYFNSYGSSASSGGGITVEMKMLSTVPGATGIGENSSVFAIPAYCDRF